MVTSAHGYLQPSQNQSQRRPLWSRQHPRKSWQPQSERGVKSITPQERQPGFEENIK
jgi:hypothetical protein